MTDVAPRDATNLRRSRPAQTLSPTRARRAMRVAGLLVLGAGLLLAVILSLSVGARSIPWSAIPDALFAFDSTQTDHLVIRDLRLPRTIAGIVIGLALSAAGVLMQGITRNPLADPGLLGVNSGASLAVVLAIWTLGITSPANLVWFSFVGAGTVSVMVYVLGSASRGGTTPVRLALAGAALNALLLSLVSAVLLIHQETLDTYRFWMVGSLVGANIDMLVALSPFLIVGLIAGIIAATSLNAVALGDDMARALGIGLTGTRVMTMVAITLLCGAAVALAGPIGFIGLVVPHVARAMTGADQRWMLVYAMLSGPIVLILSDVAGRVILPPGEVQVGIMTALLGGPLFIAIIRRIRLSQL